MCAPHPIDPANLLAPIPTAVPPEYETQSHGDTEAPNEFEWPFEISGFGGGYEDMCRKMAKAGVLWLREHPGELAKWREAQRRWEEETGREYMPRSAQPRSHVEFQDAIVAASGGGCTGAMLGASSSHAVAIFERGWDGYVAHVMAAREKAAKGGAK